MPEGFQLVVTKASQIIFCQLHVSHALVLIALCGLVVATACTGIPAGRDIATTESHSAIPSYAWPIAVNANTLSLNNDLNIHNPDPTCAYWIMPFTVEPRLA